MPRAAVPISQELIRDLTNLRKEPRVPNKDRAAQLAEVLLSHNVFPTAFLLGHQDGRLRQKENDETLSERMSRSYQLGRHWYDYTTLIYQR